MVRFVNRLFYDPGGNWVIRRRVATSPGSIFAQAQGRTVGFAVGANHKCRVPIDSDTVQGGLKFGGYEFWKKTIVDNVGYKKAKENRMAVACLPDCLRHVRVLRQHCSLPSGSYAHPSRFPAHLRNDLLGGFARIAKEEGIGGFYAGFGPILFKQILYNMGKKTADLSGGEATVYNLGSSLIAGSAATTISQPADTLLSKINKQKALPGDTVALRLVKMSGESGVRGLFTGLSTRLIMVGLVYSLLSKV
ncbi:unnamed protein product [Tilletia caries]|uniref:Uncharacterized protein n=1 Tax=Tilletia caries TaxID=13290 RepID=A0ABN7IT32_9BASI|nr:unnamed protein product [Tilletia caries]